MFHWLSFPRTEGNPTIFVIRFPMHIARALIVPQNPLRCIGGISDKYKGQTPQNNPLKNNK